MVILSRGLMTALLLSPLLLAAAPPGVPPIAGRPDAPIRGIVRAGAEATLTARLAARIQAMPRQDGEPFRKGELLVQFDCERPQAELRAAQAQHQVQRRQLDAQVELEKFGATGKTEVDVARAQADKARADVEALQAQLRDCAISAPFSGRVVERLARAHEGVAVSQPLLRIQDTSTIELDLIVPSNWLVWLQPGTRFAFRIDETQQTIEAAVHRLGAAVDPVSRTVRIVARFRGDVQRVLPGMSGTALLSPPATTP